MDSSTIIATEAALEAGLYPKRPVAIVRGEGARLWDADGRMFLDCVGGQGAANLGHSHPAIVAAIQQQASSLISCPEIFHNDQRAAYLSALTAALPFPARVFLCNSGAEAVEASLKFARLLTGRTRIVAAMRGFHGRTMGALSATWEPKYREPFAPLVPDFQHVPFDDVEALGEAVNSDTAAVLLEPVQGEGGVRPASPGYLALVRRICDESGALLLVDEVQTGFGRTGKLFAIEHSRATDGCGSSARTAWPATASHARHHFWWRATGVCRCAGRPSRHANRRTAAPGRRKRRMAAGTAAGAQGSVDSRGARGGPAGGH